MSKPTIITPLIFPDLPSAMPGQLPLVLIADDDPSTRMLLRLTLERGDLRVADASDGAQAIDMARELHPDLIIMDIRMPKLTGFEAIERLRQDSLTARIPIICLTATSREPSDAARGLQIGADDYLHKPFNTDELLTRVRSRINARQLEERLQQRTNELEALTQIGAQLNEALALDELANKLLAITLSQLPAAFGALILLGQDSRPLLFRSRTMSGETTDLTADNAAMPGSLLVQTLASGEARLVIDATTEPGGGLTILPGIEGRAGIAVPLIHRGQTLGAVLLGDLQPGRFNTNDLRMLRSIGEQSALAVRNAQLYDELNRYAQGLESMIELRTSALQTAHSRLARTEKLASIGTLAAGLAHEINNPLQSVLACLQMALESLDEDRLVDREMLEVAERESRRVQRLVTRLLDFARNDHQSLTRLNMSELVNDVLTLTNKPLQDAGVETLKYLSTVPMVLGSADQLKQVILNLVMNALQAMPNGGTLTVRTIQDEATICIMVADTGIGIGTEALPRIFDPFYTTKADGTGLGLAISYQIIEGHGGMLEVQSTVGVGTTFTIWLPVAKIG